MNRQQIIPILKGQKDLLRRFSVKQIYIFGSAARDEATNTSDVDLLVGFNSNARASLFQFYQLCQELSQVSDCGVDQATPNSLHHGFISGEF